VSAFLSGELCKNLFPMQLIPTQLGFEPADAALS